MFKFISSTVLALCAVMLTHAQHEVKGVVRDSKNGAALPGATVQVAGSRSYAIADEFGRFTLRKIRGGSYDLLFEFVGY